MTTKPYKGEIHGWKKIYFPMELNHLCEGLGFKIVGKPIGHPTFVNWIVTSEVVKFDATEGRIETLNSTYTLIGLENTTSHIR